MCAGQEGRQQHDPHSGLCCYSGGSLNTQGGWHTILEIVTSPSQLHCYLVCQRYILNPIKPISLVTSDVDQQSLFVCLRNLLPS